MTLNARITASALLATLFVLFSAGTGCAPETAEVAFKHEFTEGPSPWSHDRFDDSIAKFTFAIVSDLYGGEREGVFEVAMEQLSLIRPELILTVGDLIDGGTEDRAQLEREWGEFDAKAAKALAPVFYVGGNHDLTNQTMREVWAKRYGARYYHFVYKNVLFLVLDTEDYSSERMEEIYQARAEALEVLYGETPQDALSMEYYQMPERVTGEIGREQSDHFLRVLAENADVVWTWVIMHKPVWQREDEPEFAALEEALSDRPYTVVNGHLHTYSRLVKNGRDYLTLGTTAGSQNSASEMSFDHVTLVTMTENGPSIAHLRMDGILDKNGLIPSGGDSLCFQASRCGGSNW